MASSTFALSGRSIYDSGAPQPGQTLRNDPGQLIQSGYVAGDLHFGRLCAPFVIQTDGNKLFAPLTASHTFSDGVTVYSDDAIAARSAAGIDGALKYSANEACGVIRRGYVIMECLASLSLNNTALTVYNGSGSTGDEADVGKLSQATGDGYSTTTGLRLVRKISATLAEVLIEGPITLAAG